MALDYKPVRLCFIPLVVSDAVLHMKAMREVHDLTGKFQPLDLIFIHLANSAFWENPELELFKEFKNVFHDTKWEEEWNEDIHQERERRRIKNEPISSVDMDTLLRSRIEFNGVTLFLIETDDFIHTSVRSLLGEILRAMALQLDIDVYRQYAIFKEYCAINELPIVRTNNSVK